MAQLIHELLQHLPTLGFLIRRGSGACREASTESAVTEHFDPSARLRRERSVERSGHRQLSVPLVEVQPNRVSRTGAEELFLAACTRGSQS